jgi:hypothetical protein
VGRANGEGAGITEGAGNTGAGDSCFGVIGISKTGQAVIASYFASVVYGGSDSESGASGISSAGAGFPGNSSMSAGVIGHSHSRGRPV